MSIRTALQRSVLGVLLDTIGLQNMTDEDFAFVEMAAEYGSRRDKDNSDFGATEVTHIMPAAATLDTMKPPEPAPAPQPAPLPQPASVGLDRGPEPQTVEETLDTTAPKPAEGGSFDPPPDYERIAPKA